MNNYQQTDMLKEKILIVEDEPATYRRLERIFSEKGLQVLALPAGGIISGYEAVAAVLEHDTPDIALLDIQLSGDVDGIDLGIMLKRRYNTQVLYLSNHASDRNIQRVAAAGQFNFIAKRSLLESDEQLWINFELARASMLQNRNEGESDPVQQNDDFYELCSKVHLSNMQPVNWNAKGIRRLFTWDNIVLITSISVGKYKSMICEHDSSFGYLVDKPLVRIVETVPHRFIQINRHDILNLDKVKALGRRKVYTKDPDLCKYNTEDKGRISHNPDTQDVHGWALTLGGKTYREKFLEKMRSLNKQILIAEDLE